MFVERIFDLMILAFQVGFGPSLGFAVRVKACNHHLFFVVEKGSGSLDFCLFLIQSSYNQASVLAMEINLSEIFVFPLLLSAEPVGQRLEELLMV